MRAAIADVVVLFCLHLLSWRCVNVLASGGALDSTTGYYAGPSHTPTSKLPSFSTSLSDGLAQAVAYESGMFFLNKSVSFKKKMENLAKFLF